MTILEFKPKAKTHSDDDQPRQWEFVCDCGGKTFAIVKEEGDEGFYAECLECESWLAPAFQEP